LRSDVIIYHWVFTQIKMKYGTLSSRWYIHLINRLASILCLWNLICCKISKESKGGKISSAEIWSKEHTFNNWFSHIYPHPHTGLLLHCYSHWNIEPESTQMKVNINLENKPVSAQIINWYATWLFSNLWPGNIIHREECKAYLTRQWMIYAKKININKLV
jgi:hypothetical protein